MTELDNVDKLVLRLKKLSDQLKELKKHGQISVEKLNSDKLLSSALERQLEVACEIALDIARLVNTDQRLPVAEDYKGYIVSLGKANILPAEFATEFSKIAGFRNILAHDYLDIDPKQIVDKINNHLVDFDTFIRSIAQFYELKK